MGRGGNTAEQILYGQTEPRAAATAMLTAGDLKISSRSLQVLHALVRAQAQAQSAFGERAIIIEEVLEQFDELYDLSEVFAKSFPKAQGYGQEYELIDHSLRELQDQGYLEMRDGPLAESAGLYHYTCLLTEKGEHAADNSQRAEELLVVPQL